MEKCLSKAQGLRLNHCIWRKKQEKLIIPISVPIRIQNSRGRRWTLKDLERRIDGSSCKATEYAFSAPSHSSIANSISPSHMYAYEPTKYKTLISHRWMIFGDKYGKITIAEQRIIAKHIGDNAYHTKAIQWHSSSADSLHCNHV